MGKIDNIEVRKKKNEPFCKAFDYLAELKQVSDKVLAELIGSKGPYISMYRNGTKPVPMEIMENLVLRSEGELNMEYLLGNSDYMLLRNVPEDEIADMQMRKSNPDYDVLKSRRAAFENKTENTPRQIDQSSYLNALLAKADETIASLKRELAQMSERLEEKDERIKELKELADERLHRIALLRHVIDANKINMTDYPFPIGTAEDSKQSQRKH